MVQQGDMDVSLVHADSKQKFKEHTKDGKVYVEVEPDAEYFIRVERVGKTGHPVLAASVSVDEKSLGYHKTFPKVGKASYMGLRACENGISTHTALKFTKPRLAPDGGGNKQPSRLLMGKVEVKISIPGERVESTSESFHSDWKESTVDQNQAGSLAKKKGLRSGEGSTTFSKQSHVHKCKLVKTVDVFTLNYCAALGLIEVGVLPKPPLWVHHRMLHPAKKRSTTDASTTTRHTKISRSNDGRQETDMFDLSNVKDEESDDDEE